MDITITRIPTTELVRFECPECGETWFLVLDPKGDPIGIMQIDDYHLGMMYRAAEGDERLTNAITKAVKSRKRS